MSNRVKAAVWWVVALACPTQALAIQMDGKADVSYGVPLSTQNTPTSFGNSSTGDAINSGGGSEIDQVFGVIEDGRLNVLIAGNLQPNFNKLVVFIDSVPGGVNVIDGSSLPRGLDPYCCGHFPPPDNGPLPHSNPNNVGGLQRLHSTAFDADFHADSVFSFTHGFEDALNPNLRFWALSAHYADLTQGTEGEVGGLGVQLAQRGLPRVLRRPPADFRFDGAVDGADFLAWQRNFGKAPNATRADGDATFDGVVDASDLAAWAHDFGKTSADSPFDANYYAPQTPYSDFSDALLGPTLPSLQQGELIDKNYTLGAGGATDITGAGALTRELEFVLPVVPDTLNAANHRNMENVVDLRMALDNSNVGGVAGPFHGGVGNPSEVTTGLEFSVPLSALGAPTGDVKLLAFIANWNYSYLSNQVSGEGILLNFDLGQLMPHFELEFPGKQYVTIVQPPAAAVPEPTTAPLAFCGASIAFWRRWPSR
jgi:hypothetical protein